MGITMDSIADALVYSVACLNHQEEEQRDDSVEEDDSALGHIMAYLSHATTEEEDALAAAAERALAEEQSLYHPQQEMIDFFANWMQLMFGRDWERNRRVYPSPD